MRVKSGDHTYPEAPAKAEPAENVLTRDFYTQLPQIRLTGNSTNHPMQPKAPSETPIEVMLDGNDVAKLIECAVRHPAFNMRCAVLAAIWNHPELIPANFPVRTGGATRFFRNPGNRGGGA